MRREWAAGVWRLLALAVVAGCGSPAVRHDDGSADVAIDSAPDGGPPETRPPEPGLSVLAGIPDRQGYVDGIGMLTLFAGPDAMVTDGAGNLYVTDNGRIRRIVIATGVVTTLAGHPAAMDADGIGVDAAFHSAHGIAYDGLGNLFVSAGETLRKVNIATAAVTTLAGTSGVYGSADGTGTAASFNELRGVAADGQGNLFLADAYANNIRQVVIATGVVTTLAGSGALELADGVGKAASFKEPFGIAYDGAGNLFVVDDAAIRQIEIATGTVTTLVGSATIGSADGVGAAAGFGGQGDLKSDRNGTLFVADTGNGAIRKVAVGTRTVTTVVGVLSQHKQVLGPLPGGLAAPLALALDGSGALYISDDWAILVAR